MNPGSKSKYGKLFERELSISYSQGILSIQIRKYGFDQGAKSQ